MDYICYIYIYIHIRACIHASLSLYMHMLSHIGKTCTHRIDIYTYIDPCVYICVWIYACMKVFTVYEEYRCTGTYIYIYLYTCMYSLYFCNV